MALVPYTGSSVPGLSRLHGSTARLRFAGRDLSLQQDWEKSGVAAVVWDAAVVLCMYLELGKVELEGKRVIELGAGTGLAGIVAVLLGAHVTITDREPALELLSANVRTNLPQHLHESVVVSELTWGERLDRYPSGGFHLVLGADIVYLEDTFPALLRTLGHLSSDSTVVLLACRIRYERDTDFLSMLRQQFSVEEVYYEEQRDIHVYKACKLPPHRDL
ncbi:protein N-lysine methyltransferase METTL21A [Cololabis saira]|uniref:protein N-lysine methyltransferase METTL21A n=1 Tax=Cololabis saira TaxID=129043 RepID=UPI002AD32184|nr:protein N-lysine methyltransferase METTL21A [Cololabis saira]